MKPAHDRFEQILNESKVKWNSVEKKQEESLIRTFVLRELSRALHKEKSYSLAGHSSSPGNELIRIERGILPLKGKKLSIEKLNLPEFLEGKQPLKLSNKKLSLNQLNDEVLSTKIKKVLGKQLFDRYDRKWEVQLVNRAIKLNWNLIWFEASVKTQDAQHFHEDLQSLLWPSAIILFVETVGLSSLPQEPSLWRGKWLIAAEPCFQTKSISTQKLRGIASQPSPPEWEYVKIA